MRNYDVALASLAIDAPSKWTDNLLSHHVIPGVIGKQRGVARRISHEGLVLVALVRSLHVSLEMSLRAATAAARVMLAPGGDGVLQSGQVRVIVDRGALERTLDLRLRDALESAPIRRRGRPPARAPRTATQTAAK